MSRIFKLEERFRSGGALSFAELERLLNAYGFLCRRISGSHHIYVRDDIADQMTVQPHGKEAKPYQVRQFRIIVEHHGLKLDDQE